MATATKHTVTPAKYIALAAATRAFIDGTPTITMQRAREGALQRLALSGHEDLIRAAWESGWDHAMLYIQQRGER